MMQRHLTSQELAQQLAGLDVRTETGEHLARCAMCQHELQRLEGGLRQLTRLAQENAPALLRPVGLPEEGVAFWPRWGRLVAVAASLLVVILLARPVQRLGLWPAVPALGEETAFLEEVADLAENPTPEWTALVPVAEPMLDEDFMRYLAPATPEVSGNAQGGQQPC